MRRVTLQQPGAWPGNVATGLITKALIFGLFMLLYQWRLFTLDGSHWWHWALAFFRRSLPITGFIAAVTISIVLGLTCRPPFLKRYIRRSPAADLDGNLTGASFSGAGCRWSDFTRSSY